MALIFSAYPSADVTSFSSNTPRKVVIDTVNFQTGSTFDTGNNRWVPGEVGIYQISGGVTFKGETLSGTPAIEILIYKNGSAVISSHMNVAAAAIGSGPGLGVSGLVQVTGAADYIELWANLYTFAGTASVYGGAGNKMLTWFTGAKMPNSPYLFAYPSADTTAFASNTFKKINHDTVVYQSGPVAFDTSNKRWTPGIPGKYQISGAVYFKAGGMNITSLPYADMAIYVNGAEVFRNECAGKTGTTDPGSWISALVDLDADDYVEWFGRLGVGSGTSDALGGDSTRVWAQGVRVA